MQKKAVYKKLGKSIKSYRELRGLTQEKLADKINKNLSFLGKIEVAYSRPSFGTIIDIANALDISLKELFDFDEPFIFHKSFADRNLPFIFESFIMENV